MSAPGIVKSGHGNGSRFRVEHHSIRVFDRDSELQRTWWDIEADGSSSDARSRLLRDTPEKIGLVPGARTEQHARGTRRRRAVPARGCLPDKREMCLAIVAGRRSDPGVNQPRVAGAHRANRVCHGIRAGAAAAVLVACAASSAVGAQ